MSHGDRHDASMSPEEAINAILEAEQISRASIARRRQEADSIVAEARRQARRIHERADARSIAAHNLCQRAGAARVAELRRRTDEVISQPVRSDVPEEDVARAIARLAAQLTGGWT